MCRGVSSKLSRRTGPAEDPPLIVKREGWREEAGIGGERRGKEVREGGRAEEEKGGKRGREEGEGQMEEAWRETGV